MLKDTINGDDGWDPRLGEDSVWLSREGDCGRLLPRLVDKVLLIGMGSTGLDSSDGPGEGDAAAEFDGLLPPIAVFA